MDGKPQTEGEGERSKLEVEAEFDFDADDFDFDFEPSSSAAEEDTEEAGNGPSAQLDAGGDPDEATESEIASEPESEDEDNAGPGALDAPGAATGRAIFERELKQLEIDVRVGRARHAADEELTAFCFDPSPRVVAALLANQRFGLEHARLVASHHRTGAGLDAVGRNSQFLRDRQVQRRLFRNSQTPQSLVLRVLQSYRLAEIYFLTAGREATERVRNCARQQLRARFPQTSAEERVRLILTTEGRCLPQLVGVALGGRAAALLCRRPLASTLLIRNLARWPSTPPPVLQHMARQPSVRRSPVLRNEILRHPNAPSQLQSELLT